MALIQSHELIVDPLYELLVPYLDVTSIPKQLSAKDPNVTSYLNHLTTLPLSSLTTTEPESLSQTKSSLLLSLQDLSKRSHISIISGCARLSNLNTELPLIAKSTLYLRESLPKLDEIAVHFSETYNTRSENELLERRRVALLLSRNIDRICSILELPTLISSAIQSSNQTALSTLSYASALDLNAHIRRLHSIFPNSPIIQGIEKQSEEAMRAMTSNIILSLKSNSLKLASAMRLVSWLRRVSPELETSSKGEGALGTLFLACRLEYLKQMLDALEPLRELADQEINCIDKEIETKEKWEIGQQTERYLKRYIEIFREQSFAIMSMYRSIFLPSSRSDPKTSNGYGNKQNSTECGSLEPASSVLATFPLYLVCIFSETLKLYLPNVKDRSSRDSLLTQVLYCAASLGRLGSDFSMILSIFSQKSVKQENEEVDDDEEWADIIKKHRMLAGRLESMVGARDV